MKWFSKQSNKQWTAIRGTADYTCLATVQARLGQKPLISFATKVDGGIESEAFKNTVVKQRLDKLNCSYVLNVSDYQCLQVDKPNVPQDELKQAARWKLKDLLDYPVEEATTDLLKIPQDPNNLNKPAFAYVVAAKNNRIGELSNQLLDADVNLQAIDVKVTAQRNLASFLEQENRGLAMLTFSALGALLTFTANAELYHTRFIEINEARVETSMERIALELQRSLDNFDRQFPHLSVSQLTVAPFDYQQEFITYLNDALYMPVVGFNLTDIFDLAEDVQLSDLGLQASMLPALGAALRKEEAA